MCVPCAEVWFVGGGPVGVVLGGWWCGDGWGCVGCGGRGDGVGGDGVGCRGVGRGNGVVVCVGDVCRRVAKVQAGGAGNRVWWVSAVCGIAEMAVLSGVLMAGALGGNQSR